MIPIVFFGGNFMTDYQDGSLTNGEKAFSLLRERGIAPKPRHYELWFVHVAGQNPALSQRIDALSAQGHVITQAQLDELYRSFIALPLDLESMRHATAELGEVATAMASQAAHDQDIFSIINTSLRGVSQELVVAASLDELRRASSILTDTTTEALERVQAMQLLLATSLASIDCLRGKLEQAEREALRDPLTGLANRRMFDAALRQAMAAAQEDRRPLALMMLDLDHFKQFNDTYGHTVGDHVLRLVGTLITRHVREGDVPARFGGEEFVVILPGADLPGARLVAERVRQSLALRPIVNRNSGKSFGTVTCSIGLAIYRTGEPAAEFLDRADQAMYRSKAAGRDRATADLN